MEQVKTQSISRTRSIVFCGLSIALITVSAWITIPIGPVPITLQIFSVAFALLLLTPKQFMATLLGYMVLGAIGLPVFSSMRGGISVLAGPTGGYLWGYIIGSILAILFLKAVSAKRTSHSKEALDKGHTQDLGSSKRQVLNFAYSIIAAFIYIVIAHICGCIQYAAVTGIDLWAAFLVATAPFIVIDILKVIAAAIAAQAVKKAFGGQL